MTIKLLVFGSGGYLGRYLIPVLVRNGGYRVTAVSSQPDVHSLFAHLDGGVEPICSSLDAIQPALAREHDVVVNLACAGVAHARESSMDSLAANLFIAHRVSLLAGETRDRLLLHFGSDTEQSHLAVYLSSSQALSLPASMVQSDTSLYSLAKVIQSSVIRHYTATAGLKAHVVMTPNIYGADDPPRSLVGAMRAAVAAGGSFTIQNPAVLKRFISIDSFSLYVIALLRDLLGRAACGAAHQPFEVSAVDFAPRMSVSAFARRQWSLLGGDPARLLGAEDGSERPACT